MNVHEEIEKRMSQEQLQRKGVDFKSDEKDDLSECSAYDVPSENDDPKLESLKEKKYSSHY